MNEALDFLSLRLIDFGLNPADWQLRLVRCEDDLSEVELRSDELILEGLADSHDWLSLSVRDKI